MTNYAPAWPVNSRGTIVVSGSGDTVVGYLCESFVPVGKDGGVLLASSRVTSRESQHQLCVFGNSISQSLNNFGTWFARKSAGSVVFYKNAGVGGNNTNQMVQRLSDIDGCTMATIMEATNDYPSGITAEQHNLNVEVIVDYCLDNAIVPIIILGPPHDDPARSEYVFDCNIRDYITARKKGVACFSVWDKYTNPLSGAWVVGASSDGIHPNPSTEQGAGNYLATSYKNGEFYTPTPRINGYDVPNVMPNSNSCFLLDTNADNTPDEWATNTLQTSRTLAVTSLGIGNTWTTVWNNSQIFLNSTRWTVTPGDTYLCTMKLSSTLNSGSCPLSVFVEYNVQVQGIGRILMVSAADVSIEACTFTCEIVIPNEVSTLRFGVSANAGTYNRTINIAQAQMFNLSHYGL